LYIQVQVKVLPVSVSNTGAHCLTAAGHYGVGRGAFPADDLKEGGGPPNHYERGRGPPLLPATPSGIYHMGTLSRASKAGGAGEQSTSY
jgi:hypothetical protein